MFRLYPFDNTFHKLGKVRKPNICVVIEAGSAGHIIIVSEYNKEMPKSHTADQPMTP